MTQDAGREAIARCQYYSIYVSPRKVGYKARGTYGLVLEDGCKVSDDVDDTKDEAVLAPHGQVRATSVSRHGVGGGCRSEEIVHRGDGTDLL